MLCCYLPEPDQTIELFERNEEERKVSRRKQCKVEVLGCKDWNTIKFLLLDIIMLMLRVRTNADLKKQNLLYKIGVSGAFYDWPICTIGKIVKLFKFF